MKTVIVGIANLQTSVPVEAFPVEYQPSRYLPGRIVTSVGGVGFNVARVLAGLGGSVSLAAPLGSDVPARAILAEAERLGLRTHLCTDTLAHTPRSVVLHAPDGRRQINTDLDGALTTSFDASLFASEVAGADAAVLGNLDFSRPFLPIARDLGVPVVVDLQDVAGPDNPYDQDFLAADILVMSHERLTSPPHEFLRDLSARSTARLMVLTLGAAGSLALTADDTGPWHTPAMDVGPLANTTGAGDSFTAALTHYLLGCRATAREAVRAATTLAGTALAQPEKTLTEKIVASTINATGR